MSVLKKLKNAISNTTTAEAINQVVTNDKLWEKIFNANAINLSKKELVELAKKICYNAKKDSIIANTPLKYLHRPENYSFGVNKIINKLTNAITKVELGQLQEINNVIDLAHEVQRLNPKTEIELLKNPYTHEYTIQSNTLPEELNLPDKFYYNLKNGITNKHNVSMYMAEDVELKPHDKITDNYDIYYEIRRLNPGLNIQFGNFDMCDEPYNKKLYYQLGITVDSCNLRLPYGVDISQLNLPEGFYYNQKNGITNKHNEGAKSKTELSYYCLDVITEEATKNGYKEVRNPPMKQNSSERQM
ncbi:MAG: hypothetical protein IJZ26_01670 [Clostridia bacterium]|nr:hypothetical protein [Clostridia bacterium]